MFKRSIWWKNIGIDTTFFLEDINAKEKPAADYFDFTTTFPSLKDEFTFSIVSENTARGKKKFAYLLTENTHTPYQGPEKHIEDSSIIYFGKRISAGASAQSDRIQELLFFFIDKVDKNQWSKVVIVGDHMPPFTRESDRKFYSSIRVPYIILSAIPKKGVIGSFKLIQYTTYNNRD